MVRLNKQVEYSLICLRHMTGKRPGELTAAREISSSCETPFDATSRALQKLAQMGILKSEQGPSGGYLIVKDLSKISLKALIEGTLGPMGIVKCLQDSSCELQGKCNIVSAASYLNHKVLDLFDEITLGELMKVGEKTASRTNAETTQPSPIDGDMRML